MINWEFIHNKLIIEKKVENKGVGIERHHIIPKHDGGNDEESNLVYLPRRYHILIHYIRWRWLNKNGDKIAYCYMHSMKIHPMLDPEHKDKHQIKMNSKEYREKISLRQIERYKDSNERKLVGERTKKYHLSLENPSDAWKQLHTLESWAKISISRKIWCVNNPEKIRESMQRALDAKSLKFSTLIGQERRSYASLNNSKVRYQGGIKLFNKYGENYLFYTVYELKYLTKINPKSLYKILDTDIPLKRGKWKGFYLQKLEIENAIICK